VDGSGDRQGVKAVQLMNEYQSTADTWYFTDCTVRYEKRLDVSVASRLVKELDTEFDSRVKKNKSR
jgi:hypothetical protein